MTHRLVHAFRVSTLLFAAIPAFAEVADPLETGFREPPLAARPWVYWFWNNGNVTREGITADLEAMQRVGLGGVLIMDVVEKFAPPRGTAIFMGNEWRAMFAHALTESARLGLEVNMCNGPGWCGSSGPWITPAQSMQRLVSSDTAVEGPLGIEVILPQPVIGPPPKDDLAVPVVYPPFYQDVAVLAFPIKEKGPIAAAEVVDLSNRMDANGKLTWEVPPGEWTIRRIGHTTTGMTTRPPVLGGSGLECDKLSREAVDTHFAGMMERLIRENPATAGKTLAATHIDSWEVKSQNWTPKMREEFRRRRGYDLLPHLVTLTGMIPKWVNGKPVMRFLSDVGGKGLADRFRWDFQQTLAELLAENYVGRLAELAHGHGLRLTVEGYNLPFGDEFNYAARADEPMSEFWTPFRYGVRATAAKGRQMASVAHIHGKTIVGAEAFTSGDTEEWRWHPATVKALGDRQFCEGINRFVFHRYAHQPWLDRAPGSTMGPWGLHYERTQTWWEMSRPWHDYLARCQFLLRQGHHVADLCYLRPEIPAQTYFNPVPAVPAGYRYDECSVAALISRVTVNDGRLILPDGMTYRLLVLPAMPSATPELIDKLTDLARQGAILLATGPPPRRVPGLQGFPGSDARLVRAARQLWGQCDGKTITENAVGKGKLIWGPAPAAVLANLGCPPDFESPSELRWIHRRTPTADLYFVANTGDTAVAAECGFRLSNRQPEQWDPMTGQTRTLRVFQNAGNRVVVTLNLNPADSTFIIFRKPYAASQHVVSVTRDGTPLAADKLSATATFAGPGDYDILTADGLHHAATVAATPAPLDLKGPWEVSFPPKTGAPSRLVLDPLQPLETHQDPGVRHFSGTASYTMDFTVTSDWLQAAKRAEIDLGSVHVMALVTLNGRDLGTVWRAPFRVDATAALQAGSNRLQVRVANLWPNRMIADAQLPEAERITWSTWQPFTKDSPLPPSGLQGPVIVHACQPFDPISD